MNGEEIICLLNPTTSEYVELPESKQRFKTVNLGLGIDPASGEYKVVRAFSDPHNSTSWEILTISHGQQWRHIGKSPVFLTRKSPYFPSAPVFLHGVLHWATCRLTTENYNEPAAALLTFDIENERFGSEISFPQCTSQGSSLTSIGRLGEHIFLSFSNGIQKQKIEIWMLEDYTGRRWIKIPDQNFYRGCITIPLGAVHLIGIEDNLILFSYQELNLENPMWDPVNICSFDLQEKTLHKLAVRQGFYEGSFEIYRDSIISPRILFCNHSES